MDGTRPGFAVDLFAKAARDYDRVASVLSYGQYLRWQGRLVESAVAGGVDDTSRVLDVATGTGGVAHALSAATGCHVTGLDQSPDMLAGARARHQDDDRFALLLGTADRLPFLDASFDALTFTYLLRYVPDPRATLRELVRVVKPGGFVGLIDFHVPPQAFWKGMWRLHTRLVLPLGGRLHSRGWYDVGRFLGPNIEHFYRTWDVRSLADACGHAGLVDVRHHLMSLGGGIVMHGRRGEVVASAPTAIEVPHAR